MQRGHHRKPCFSDEQDDHAYLQCRGEAPTRERYALHVYVLMTALVIVPATIKPEVEALAGRPRVCAALVRLKPRPPVRESRVVAGAMIKALMTNHVQLLVTPANA